MVRVEHLRPSGAATWVVCSGHVAMIAAYPDAPEEVDNDVREDGTACHWLATEIWEGRHPAENSLSPNNRVLDEDMFDAVDMYHDVLKARNDAEWYIEKPVTCNVIYPGMKGTPDAWSYRPGWLRVVDLKYGFRFVEVWDNWQLIVYALSILHMLGVTEDCMVELTIVQPRSSHRDGPVRTWTTRRSNLEGHLATLRARAIDAMGPTPVCTPNPGCVDCPGSHACTALQASSLTALEVSYKGVPLELTPAAVGDELRRLKEAEKRIVARITGLESHAESLLRSGKPVPYWTLAPRYGKERWQDGVESQVLTLGKYYNADLAKPITPISPARARKLLPKGIAELYSVKPSTGVKLVKTDPYAAKKAFANE